MALSPSRIDREQDKFVATVAGDTSVRVTNADLSFNSDGELYVVAGGHVSANNSSSTPLNAGIAFTGSSEDILDVSIIMINVFSNVASATNGLSVEQSSDGSNWDLTDVFTVPANSGKTYSFQPSAQYFRVVYTNGGVDQTSFRLQTIFKHTNTKPSSHRISDSIIDDDDAELVTSVLKAKANGGGYVNIQATASNNLRVTDAESGLAIAKNDVTGTTFIHKFGDAPDFDTGDGEVTVWDGANDGGIDEMTYNYSSSAIIDSIISDAAGTQNIEVQGLDANYDLVTQTVALDGTTRVALTTDLIRVFRMKNVGGADLVGNVYCYENTADTTPADGIPDDTSKIRAVISVGNNQTLMALYTIPAGKTGYLRSFFASLSGAKKSSNYIIRVKARPFGQVFQLKHKTALTDVGTSHFQHVYMEPEVFGEKADIEITVETTESSITASDVSAGFDMVLVDN